MRDHDQTSKKLRGRLFLSQLHMVQLSFGRNDVPLTTTAIPNDNFSGQHSIQQYYTKSCVAVQLRGILSRLPTASASGLPLGTNGTDGQTYFVGERGPAAVGGAGRGNGRGKTNWRGRTREESRQDFLDPKVAAKKIYRQRSRENFMNSSKRNAACETADQGGSGPLCSRGTKVENPETECGTHKVSWAEAETAEN